MPEFGRRAYFSLLAALVVTSACGWALALALLRPHAALGAVWAVMTVAALLPSSAPMVATYTSLHHAAAGALRASSGAVAFVGGYLLTWCAAGSVVTVFASVPDGAALDRYVDTLVLALAAGYELTPHKRYCLASCRVPLSFVMSAWRDGVGGAFDMGARYGMRCVGACIGLVIAVFELQLPALEGLALVGVLVAAQKLAPGRTVVIRLTAVLLLAAAAAVLLGQTPA